MKIAIIDNYDSFVYNLSHLVKELGAEVSVLRNDQFRMEELEAFDKILLSPGPAFRKKPVCCSMSSVHMRARNRFWVSAWANRPSVKSTEHSSATWTPCSTASRVLSRCPSPIIFLKDFPNAFP